MTDPSTAQKTGQLPPETNELGGSQSQRNTFRYSQLLQGKQFLSDGVPFWKGQGTGNDFVLIPDPQGALQIDASSAAKVCNRHLGIGADGLIRAVRSENIPEGRALLPETPEAEWFMDYRNADGSVAEMCGNGVRAFVHFLISLGLVELPEGAKMAVGTRAGVKWVARTPKDYEIDMGPWRLTFPEQIAATGADAKVALKGQASNPAISIDMGNPHTVVILPATTPLEILDLATEPAVEPRPVSGTNVEFATMGPLPEAGAPASVDMRVFERSVGETQACGTGACAVAAAVRHSQGLTDVPTWIVNMPGGPVQVSFKPVVQPDGTTKEHVYLQGPARMVASGTFSPEMWEENQRRPYAFRPTMDDNRTVPG